MYTENWNEVRSNRHRGIHRSLDSVWGLQVQKWKTSPVYGMQTQDGQTFARHMLNLFVSHVNKFTKWPVARHIQMLVSVTCMSSNNNQVFVMWFSIWQCQCFCFSVTMVRFVVPWYCLFDSVSVQDIYNWNITVLVCCSMKCYNVKKS